MSKPVLIVSFSGGRTSAFMAKWLKDNKGDQYDIKYVFANTGLEHPKTLEFINECDNRWNLGVVWIEAAVNSERGKGTGYRVVSYETASRNSEPFEEVVKVYGIGNADYPHCNREMKLIPMQKWRKENYPGSYFAIGIRADEFDRMSVNADKDKLIYPLIGMRHTTKAEVVDWWSSQDFDLEIPEHYGNCVTCWKKSDRKLFTIAKHHPEWFDFMIRMEKEHSFSGAPIYRDIVKVTDEIVGYDCNCVIDDLGTYDDYGDMESYDFECTCGSENRPIYKKIVIGREQIPRKWFRKHRTTADIIASSKESFNEFVDYKPEYQLDMFGLDEHSGCEESCEAF